MVFGTANSTVSFKFTFDRPLLPWQRNWRQNTLYLGLYDRYQRDPCVYQGVFGVGLLNDVSQILPRPTLVGIATEFEEFGRKLAITWFA